MVTQAAISEGVWRCHTARRWGTSGKLPAHAGVESRQPAHPMGVAYAGILVSGPMQVIPPGPPRASSTSPHAGHLSLRECQSVRSQQSSMMSRSLNGRICSRPAHEPANVTSCSGLSDRSWSHDAVLNGKGPVRDLYIAQHKADMHLQCRNCKRGRIVPIVYGFPSGPLLTAGKEKRAVNGGDYLIASEPVWACNSCSARFAAFPCQDVMD